MIEKSGDIWRSGADVICIPTNGTVGRRGQLIMGAGLAKQAADRYRKLPNLAGNWVSQRGNVVGVFHFDRAPIIVTFPTKWDWRDKSDINLIRASAKQLANLADASWFQLSIALPRVGCGLGGLAWEQVRPVLSEHLDDRFTVVHQGD